MDRARIFQEAREIDHDAKQESEDEIVLWEREGCKFIQFSLHHLGVRFLLEQDTGGVWESGLGGLLWDPAEVMSRYFTKLDVFPHGHFYGKTCLEVGSGIGLGEYNL